MIYMMVSLCSAPPKVPFSSRPPSLLLWGQGWATKRDLSPPTRSVHRWLQPHLGNCTDSLSLTVSLTVEGASSLEINLSQLAHSSPGGCEENDQGSATRLVCLVNQRERRGGRQGGRQAAARAQSPKGGKLSPRDGILHQTASRLPVANQPSWDPGKMTFAGRVAARDQLPRRDTWHI